MKKPVCAALMITVAYCHKDVLERDKTGFPHKIIKNKGGGRGFVGKGMARSRSFRCHVGNQRKNNKLIQHAKVYGKLLALYVAQ